MKLCIECGRSINRGATGSSGENERCLVCRVERDLRTWHYPASQDWQRLIRERKARKATA